MSTLTLRHLANVSLSVLDDINKNSMRTTLGKPYANLALYQANANFGALVQRPFFKWVTSLEHTKTLMLNIIALTASSINEYSSVTSSSFVLIAPIALFVFELQLATKKKKKNEQAMGNTASYVQLLV